MTKLFLSALLILAIATMLTACGDPATSTSVPIGGSAAATAATSVTPDSTATITTPFATSTTSATATPITTSASNPATITPRSTQNGYNPVISFSATSLKIGDSLTVSGSGYPANTKLNVILTTTSLEAGQIFGNAGTDEQGKFSTKIYLKLSENQISDSKGRVVVAVTTEDAKVAASAPITVTIVAPAAKPVLTASATTVRIGAETTLNGSGFPANTALQVVGGVQNVNENYGNIATDGQGKFSKTVTLPQSVTLGQYFIDATTGDFKYQARVELNVLPAEQKVAPEVHVLGINPATKIGAEFTLGGRGFPANTELQLTGGVQNPVVNWGTVKTDAQGNFTKTLKLDQAGLIPGQFFVYASTSDYKHQAHVELNLTA